MGKVFWHAEGVNAEDSGITQGNTKLAIKFILVQLLDSQMFNWSQIIIVCLFTAQLTSEGFIVLFYACSLGSTTGTEWIISLVK